jgi:hypothetical protein
MQAKWNLIGLFAFQLVFMVALCCESVAAPQYPIPEDTVIVLQRHGCEDECPVYRVVIFDNGDVVWDGEARVRRLGVVLAHITRDQVRMILDAFNSLDYFSLDNIYGAGGKGCVSTTRWLSMVATALSEGGRAKTLSHHSGCSGEVSSRLSAVEDLIDQVVNTGRWIGK